MGFYGPRREELQLGLSGNPFAPDSMKQQYYILNGQKWPAFGVWNVTLTAKSTGIVYNEQTDFGKFKSIEEFTYYINNLSNFTIKLGGEVKFKEPAISNIVCAAGVFSGWPKKGIWKVKELKDGISAGETLEWVIDLNLNMGKIANVFYGLNNKKLSTIMAHKEFSKYKLKFTGPFETVKQASDYGNSVLKLNGNLGSTPNADPAPSTIMEYVSANWMLIGCAVAGGLLLGVGTGALIFRKSDKLTKNPPRNKNPKKYSVRVYCCLSNGALVTADTKERIRRASSDEIAAFTESSAKGFANKDFLIPYDEYVAKCPKEINRLEKLTEKRNKNKK